MGKTTETVSRFLEELVDIQKTLCLYSKEGKKKLSFNHLSDPNSYSTGALLDIANEIKIQDEDVKNKLRSMTAALTMIKSEYRNIIIKEFLFVEEKNWWMAFYSRSTFYRKRNRAIEEFMKYYGI